jgi:hypothetical protein
MPATTKPIPGARLKASTRAARTRAIAPNATAQSTASGIARAAVSQRTSRPKTMAAIRSVHTPISSARSSGKRAIDIVENTGPNGDRISRSKVPVSSSERSTSASPRAEWMTDRITRPTATKAK